MIYTTTIPNKQLIQVSLLHHTCNKVLRFFILGFMLLLIQFNESSAQSPQPSYFDITIQLKRNGSDLLINDRLNLIIQIFNGDQLEYEEEQLDIRTDKDGYAKLQIGNGVPQDNSEWTNINWTLSENKKVFVKGWLFGTPATNIMQFASNVPLPVTAYAQSFRFPFKQVMDNNSQDAFRITNGKGVAIIAGADRSGYFHGKPFTIRPCEDFKQGYFFFDQAKDKHRPKLEIHSKGKINNTEKGKIDSQGPYIDLAIDKISNDKDSSQYKDYYGRLIVDAHQKEFEIVSREGLHFNATSHKFSTGSVLFDKNIEVKGSIKTPNIIGRTTFQNDLIVLGNTRLKTGTVDNYLEVIGKKNIQFYSVKFATGSNTRGNWEYKDELVTKPVSIKAEDRIVSKRFICESDERIKNKFSPLPILNITKEFQNIHFYNYSYKSNSSIQTIGVKAQELEEIFPNAVDKISGFLPNIMKPAQIKSIGDNEAILTLDTSINISEGMELRLFGKSSHDVVIKRIEFNNVIFDKFTQEKLDEVFVYGTKVNDLRAVDYNYIFTTNAVVTQELIKQTNKLEQQISSLQNENEDLFNSVNELSAKLEIITSLLEARANANDPNSSTAVSSK